MDEELENTNEEVNQQNDAHLSMSDEDFMNAPPETVGSATTESIVEEEKGVKQEEETTTEVSQEEVKSVSEETKQEEKAPSEEVTTEEEGKSPEQEAEATIDYEAGFKEIMAPFKANGKEIKLNNPKEAIQLMQMGANYTKKMQALQPHLKTMQMLENHGLLDEGKLSYLIDLSKNNPQAIQKLIKDSGIDPLDIDSEDKSDYKPNDYTVPDAEFVFRRVADEVSNTQEGSDLLAEVGKQWDDQSKRAIFADPKILTVMTEQRGNGIYQIIVDEIDRRKTFGQLGNVPFVQAYLEVGQELHQQNKLVVPQAKVVDTRTAPPKAPAVKNDAKAKAAAPTRATPTKVKEDFNPLAMSDEEFMKSDLARRM